MADSRSNLARAAAAGVAAMAVNKLMAFAAEQNYPPAGRFIDVEGCKIHYVDHGTGSPVLYLHGNGAMVQEVEATGLIDAIARNHRIIVMDRPGFGHSQRPRQVEWTPEHQADLIAELMDRLGARPALVVGHSWGALLAVALALRHPRHVRGLVLICGYYYPDHRIDETVGILASPVIGDVLRHTVAPVGSRLLAPLAISRVFEPNPVTDRFRELYPVSLAVRPSQLRALGEENGMLVSSAARLCQGYGRIDCPVFILAGAEDRIVATARQSGRLASDIKGAKLRVIDGVGHMLPHFERFAVMDALAHVDGSARAVQAEPGAPLEPVSHRTH